MSSVLRQLSFAFGALMFLVAFALGMLNEVSLPVALYRAAVVMAVSLIAAALFFRYFTRMVLAFVHMRVMEIRKQRSAAAATAAAQQRAASGA